MKRGLLQLSGIVIDLVHRVDHLPAPGEEVETADFVMTAGGGFNAMVAAKRMGVPVTYGGMLGQGVLADLAVRHLTDEGIAVAGWRRAPMDQGSCAVIVDRTGERSFISHHGAERQVDPRHLEELGAPSYEYALLTGYSLYKNESASAFLPWLATLGERPLLFFDPGPTVANIPRTALDAVLARANWISANAREAQVLTGDPEPSRAAAQLAKDRAGAMVRVGADGCWLAQQGNTRHIRGFEVRCIDSNGAGDTHDGAFLAALISGAEALEAAVLANAAAALSTTMIGPATSPDLTETRRFLELRGRSAEWIGMA